MLSVPMTPYSFLLKSAIGTFKESLFIVSLICLLIYIPSATATTQTLITIAQNIATAH